MTVPGAVSAPFADWCLHCGAPPAPPVPIGAGLWRVGYGCGCGAVTVVWDGATAAGAAA